MENLEKEFANTEKQLDISAEIQFLSDLKEFSYLVSANNTPLKAIKLFKKIIAELSLSDIDTRQKLMGYLIKFFENNPALNIVHERDYRYKIYNLYLKAKIELRTIIEDLDETIADNLEAYIPGQNTAINKRVAFVINYTNFSTKYPT